MAEQGETPAKSWKIWKEAMNGLTERGRLRRPLGRWFPGLYAGEWWYNPEDEVEMG